MVNLPTAPQKSPGSSLQRLGNAIPVASPFYGPEPTAIATAGVALVVLGASALLVPTGWVSLLVVLLGVYLILVGLLRSSDPCDNLDKARLEARNHMARFTGWLDTLDATYKSGIADRPGWRELDDEAAMDFARYVVTMSRGHDEYRHKFHEQRRALEHFFSCCEKTRHRRKRWFLHWFAEYSQKGKGWYTVLRMVVMIGRVLAGQDEGDSPSPLYVELYAAIKRGDL